VETKTKEILGGNEKNLGKSRGGGRGFQRTPRGGTTQGGTKRGNGGDLREKKRKSKKSGEEEKWRSGQKRGKGSNCKNPINGDVKGQDELGSNTLLRGGGGPG